MRVIRYRIEQPQDMHAGLRVEAIIENRIRRGADFRQFGLRIIDDDLARIRNSKLGTDLKRNPHTASFYFCHPAV